jgi:RNA polymerase sigma-70 factor, ECF subfamily
VTSDPREHAARRALAIGLRTATPLLGSREEAADVAQDVALDVLRALPGLRDPQALDAWIHRIAVRRTLLAARRRRAAGMPTGSWAGEEERHEAAPDIDHDARIALRAALAEALTALPQRQAMALVLHYVHDLSDREVAEALGCRRGTAGALLSRGRAALREVPALQHLHATMKEAAP